LISIADIAVSNWPMLPLTMQMIDKQSSSTWNWLIINKWICVSMPWLWLKY